MEAESKNFIKKITNKSMNKTLKIIGSVLIGIIFIIVFIISLTMRLYEEKTKNCIGICGSEDCLKQCIRDEGIFKDKSLKIFPFLP